MILFLSLALSESLTQPGPLVPPEFLALWGSLAPSLLLLCGPLPLFGFLIVPLNLPAFQVPNSSMEKHLHCLGRRNFTVAEFPILVLEIGITKSF